MSSDPGFSETQRQAVHMAVGGFALLLRWLVWWHAALFAAGAVAFNLFALPALAGERLYRPGDRGRALHGIALYPFAVLMLILCFPHRPAISAAAWGVLAFGDGAATLAGRAIGGRRWPWNQDKTMAGSAAFVLVGGAAAVALAWWCAPVSSPSPSPAYLLVAPVVAALIAAAVETIPVRLDDNLSVAAAAGATLWIASLVDPALVERAWPGARVMLLPAALANAAAAWTGLRARTVSVSGAVTGAAIGFIIFVAAGWQGWVLLLITFVAASIVSRLGLQRKSLLGIAEERGGRRGAGNAIANTGVAAVAACLVLASDQRDAALTAFVAALTAGGSDTIASEIGKAWGRRTWSITTLRRVTPGTSGAMSPEGTAAGILGAIALCVAAIALHLIPAAALVPIVAGATAGALLESWLGATFEGPGILNNDVLNFVNTAAAALVAIALSGRA